MKKISLVVTLEYKSESKSEFMQALLSHKERCLNGEAGTLQFEVMHPSDGNNKVILFELYADSNALNAHDTGSSLAIFKEQAGSFITSVVIHQCEVV